MVLGKPIATLNKFANMGDNGIFWLQCMETRSLGSSTILSPAWATQFMFSEDTTGFSDIDDAFLAMQSWSSRGSSSEEIVGFTGSKLISFSYSFYSTASENRGKIHTKDSSLATSANPGLVITKNNNILFTTEQHVGIGYKRVATGASSTSITVSGTDFTALGITAGDSKRNKCYNLTRKEEYTITSVSGTGNITINFATASVTPQIGDYIMVFVDDKFAYNCGSSISKHFDGQQAPVYWQRQGYYWKAIGAYYFLNGNYVGKLNSDDSTWAETHKELPLATQAMCMGANMDRMLIGGMQGQKGTLMVWDGVSPGFLSIIEIQGVPTSIVPYNTGWIVLIGASLYYTDGYSLQKISSVPDTNERTSKHPFSNIMAAYGDNIVVGSYHSSYNRFRSGVYVYNMANGWVYSPVTYGTKKGEVQTTSLCHFNNNGVAEIVLSGRTNNAAITYPVFRLNRGSQINDSAVCVYIKLPQKQSVSLVELNVSPQLPYQYQEADTNITVTVNYGDGKKHWLTVHTSGDGASTTTFVNSNGATYPGAVGQLIEPTQGDIAGERSYIASIANPGTNNEVWTLSPALSASPSNEGIVRRFNLRKAGSTTVPSNNIPDELIFPISGFYSDKLFLEIFISSTWKSLDIHSINIY